MTIYFVNDKIILEAAQLQNRWILLFIHTVSTVPVHHMCSVANQGQAYDMYHSSVECVHWHLCAHQNCMQHCMYMPIF